MSVELGPPRYDAVLFDFHGVLCHDFFYAGLEARYPDVHTFVEQHVFGGTSDIVDRWTRGELSSDDVNRFISARTGLDFDVLSAEFRASVAQMRVDARLLEVAAGLRRLGVSVGIVTGNMDVFREIVVPRNRLDQVFQAIVSSCDYGCQKDEENGRLFDVALEMLGRPGEYGRALLVDDSERSRAVFRAKGGSTFPYTDFLTFHNWAEATFSLA